MEKSQLLSLMFCLVSLCFIHDTIYNPLSNIFKQISNTKTSSMVDKQQITIALSTYIRSENPIFHQINKLLYYYCGGYVGTQTEHASVGDQPAATHIAKATRQNF